MHAEYRIPRGNPRTYALTEISVLGIIYLPTYLPIHNLVQKKSCKKNYPRKNLSKVVENVCKRSKISLQIAIDKYSSLGTNCSA